MTTCSVTAVYMCDEKKRRKRLRQEIEAGLLMSEDTFA
jgi:hypothetical protein